MREISDYWGGFLAGFSAADGCFVIGKRCKNNPCANYACQFTIDLRDDDKPILEKIRDILGFGTINDYPAQTNHTLNARPSSRFQVQAINECAELVELFEKYPLQSKKQNDFAIWKEAVKELQKPVKCRDAELLEYYYLKIREVRKYEKQAELPKPKRIELQLILEY